MPETPPTSSRTTKLIAEALGTFVIVFAGIGTALFAADFGIGAAGTSLGVGFVGVALAFGLALLAASYTWGPISGGHFNPAVTVGLAAAGKFPWKSVPTYLIAQFIGGVVGTTMLVLIGLFGPNGWLAAAQDGGFFSNGYESFSPGGFGMGAAIIAETLFAGIFVIVILGVTHPTRGTKLSGLVIALTFVVIYLATIPLDNASVNPARSLASAIYGGPDSLLQVWVFLIFPTLGGLLAGYAHRALFESTRSAIHP